MAETIIPSPPEFDNSPLRPYITYFDSEKVIFEFPPYSHGIQLSEETLKQHFSSVNITKNLDPVYSERCGFLVDYADLGLTVTCYWKGKEPKEDKHKFISL